MNKCTSLQHRKVGGQRECFQHTKPPFVKMQLPERWVIKGLYFPNSALYYCISHSLCKPSLLYCSSSPFLLILCRRGSRRAYGGDSFVGWVPSLLGTGHLWSMWETGLCRSWKAAAFPCNCLLVMLWHQMLCRSLQLHLISGHCTLQLKLRRLHVWYEIAFGITVYVPLGLAPALCLSSPFFLHSLSLHSPPFPFSLVLSFMVLLWAHSLHLPTPL